MFVGAPDKAKKQTTASIQNKVVYFEEDSEKGTSHFFLAKEESTAGARYNDLTYKGIRQKLASARATEEGTFVQRLESSCTKMIKKVSRLYLDRQHVQTFVSTWRVTCQSRLQ